MTDQDRAALYDALAAWREVLWGRLMTRRSHGVDLWSRVLARHLRSCS